MTFAVPAESYDRFMGRYSVLLSAEMADRAGISAGQRVLDVGCGTGALIPELVARVGAPSVSAVDPSEPFVEAARARYPNVGVRLASAENLPFPDDAFDAALAQLVVHFMRDPVAGIAEMKRVTRTGGVVAACVWDHGTGRGPLNPLWRAARELNPDVDGESRLVGSNEGDLTRVFAAAGLHDVEESVITIGVEHPTFDDWWEPFTFGVGPAGTYVASLQEEQRVELRERCRASFAGEPFVLTARAWTAVGRA